MLWGELHDKINATYKKTWEVIPNLGRRITILIIWILLVVLLLALSLMAAERGSIIISIVSFLAAVSIMEHFVVLKIKELVRMKNEAYARELEAFRRGLTPEEKKRLDEVYKILFPSYYAKIEEEEKKRNDS